MEEAATTEAAFLEERAAFQRLKPALLREHRGKYVAVYRGEVTVIGDSSAEVARQAYQKHGYVPLYIGLVAEGLPVVHLRSPQGRRSTE